MTEVKRFRRRVDELQQQLNSAQQRERSKGDTIMLLSRHWTQVQDTNDGFQKGVADYFALTNPCRWKLT